MVSHEAACLREAGGRKARPYGFGGASSRGGGWAESFMVSYEAACLRGAGGREARPYG